MIWFWSKILAAVLVTAATTAVILIETNVWLNPPGWFVVTAAALLGVLAGAGLVASAFAKRREEASEAFKSHVRDASGAALISLQALTGLPFEKIGLSTYLTPWWYRTFLPQRLRLAIIRLGRKVFGSRRTLFSPKLRRVERFRLGGGLPSAIKWTYGRGVVGLCWEKSMVVSFDSFKHYGSLLNCTQVDWEETVGEEVKMGMSFAEFERIRGKYGAVVAAPMLTLDDNDFLGCVSMDVPWGDHYSKVATPAVNEVLVDAAEYIQRYLGRGG